MENKIKCIAITSAILIVVIMIGLVRSSVAQTRLDTMSIIDQAITATWVYRDNTADSSSGVEIVGAPGVGKRLLISRFIMSCASAIAIYLQDEDGNTVAGGYHFSNLGGPCTLDVSVPNLRYLPENKALQYKGTGAGNVTIEVGGYTVTVN